MCLPSSKIIFFEFLEFCDELRYGEGTLDLSMDSVTRGIWEKIKTNKLKTLQMRGPKKRLNVKEGRKKR